MWISTLLLNENMRINETGYDIFIYNGSEVFYNNGYIETLYCDEYANHSFLLELTSMESIVKDNLQEKLKQQRLKEEKAKLLAEIKERQRQEDCKKSLYEDLKRHFEK